MLQWIEKLFNITPINHINGFILPMPDDPRWVLKLGLLGDLMFEFKFPDEDITLKIMFLGTNPNKIRIRYWHYIKINDTEIDDISHKQALYLWAIVKTKKYQIDLPTNTLMLRVNALTGQSSTYAP